MKVKDIMSKSMITASLSSTISEVSRTMKEYDIGFIPIEKDDNIVGVITDRDIVVRATAKAIDVSEPVEKYITADIISVDSDADLEEALKLMGEAQIKRLLVEEKRKIVGVLSLSDILSIKRDLETIEYISQIFSPFDKPNVVNEVNLIEAEIEEFEL